MESIELFALILAFFLVVLAALSVVLYWFSRTARHGFGGVNGRLSEVGFYLNEFAKRASKTKLKSAEKATVAFVEKKLLQAARDLEEEREIVREKEKRRLVAVRGVRASGKRDEKD